MSNSKVAADFDAIIQADRQRKKNEALASEIFGRNKASKTNTRAVNKNSNKTPDLASRITKRSSSVTSTNSSRNNPFNPPSRPSSANPHQNARSGRVPPSRLANALEFPQANIITSQRRQQSNGLSIKGKAGPFVVEASNFAPGTTAADIESALQSEAVDENGASGMLSCRLIKTSPSVVAEMVFAEKAVADQVISTYHNQKADGRILKLELKRSGPGSHTPIPQASQNDLVPSSDAATPEPHQPQPGTDDIMEDIEMEPEVPTPRDDRPSRERSRNADPDVTDGRYGFEGPQISDANHDQMADDDHRDRDHDRERGYERERERDHGREHGRERERERDRDRDRDRERDRDRDRNQHRDGRERYDRRDDRPPGSGSYHRDNRPGGYNSRSSHYGNGVGGPMPGPGRGGFGGGPGGFPRGGGRMYSDDVMRGGPRGRGGFGPGGYGRGRY